jgi:hypothetical protein
MSFRPPTLILPISPSSPSNILPFLKTKTQASMSAPVQKLFFTRYVFSLFRLASHAESNLADCNPRGTMAVISKSWDCVALRRACVNTSYTNASLQIVCVDRCKRRISCFENFCVVRRLSADGVLLLERRRFVCTRACCEEFWMVSRCHGM